MAEKTGITWCDSTWNGWWGCTEVTKGCSNCYAREWAKKIKGMSWGKGAHRIRTSKQNWKEPLKWNRKARAEGRRIRVFAMSMADVFDQEVPIRWREDFFKMTWETTSTAWLVLTKRPEEAYRTSGYRFESTWIGTSITGDSDIDLAHTVARCGGIYKWLSYEPALEPLTVENLPIGINWIVIGGESGPGARPFHIEWAREVIKQAEHFGIRVFMKQLGANPYFAGIPWPISDTHGMIMSEWPEDLRVQEFPDEPKKKKTVLQSSGVGKYTIHESSDDLRFTSDIPF